MNSILNALNQATAWWWPNTFHVTWQAAIVGLALLLLVWLLRRRSATLRYAILLLALLKFALPPMVSLPTGVFSHAEMVAPLAIVEAPALPASSAPEITPLNTGTASTTIPAAELATSEALSESVASSPVVSVSPTRLNWASFLLILHAIGSAVFLIWIVTALVRLRRMVRHCTPVIGGPVHAYFSVLCDHMGLYRRVRLLLGPKGSAPVALGLICPKVIIPAELIDDLDMSELSGVLAHELAHHKRLDIPAVWFENLLLAVWWFNPVLWFVIRTLRKNREDCCDDMVLVRNLADHDSYCSSLMGAARTVTRSSLFLAVLGCAETRHPLGRRIARIMDATLKRSARLSLAGILLILVLGLVMLPGLRSVTASDQAQVSSSVPAVDANQLPGTLVFEGRYRHRSRGRDIEQPASMWVKQEDSGATTVITHLPFMSQTDVTIGDKTGHIKEYRLSTAASGDRPEYSMTLEFQDGKVLLTRRGVREDKDRAELSIPPSAVFDPNSRPDPYCAAPIRLKQWPSAKGESKEFDSCDWDNTGELLVVYRVKVENAGKEEISVPAGKFEATHFVLTQVTNADTWFKKRAAQVTDYWTLDNGVIVRIVRHREPYELELLDWKAPTDLPGLKERGLGATTPLVTAAAAPTGTSAPSAEQKPPSQSLPPVHIDMSDFPGETIFEGSYRHLSRGGENKELGTLWLKENDGAITAITNTPFLSSTEAAIGDKNNHIVEYRAKSTDGKYVSKLEIAEGKIFLTRRGVREDKDRAEFAVPAGATYDPNSRPDPYCAANIILRGLGLKNGESKEFEAFDIDNTGDGYVAYKQKITHAGKETIAVPAGVFEANHLIETQVTSADTWFKKRAGHITDFWVLDNGVIVKILRHREPYEVQLASWKTPNKLPGFKRNAEPADLVQQQSPAQQPPAQHSSAQPPSGKPQPTASVSGKVSEEAGSPVEGAAIRLISWDETGEGGDYVNKTTTSAGNGSFRIEALFPNRTYRVFVQKPGYTVMYITRKIGDSETSAFDFPLGKASILEGRVLDTNGQPVPDVTLEFTPTKPNRDQQEKGIGVVPVGIGENQTDADGAFKYDNVAAGTYNVKIYKPVPSADRCYQQYPIRGPLKVEKGVDIKDLDLVVRPATECTISGTVKDADGNPIAEAVVDSFIPHDRHWWMRTDAAGKYRLLALDGIGKEAVDVYFNEVNIPGAGGYNIVAPSVPIGTSDLDLVIHKPGSASALVVDGTTQQPVTNFDVELKYVRLRDSRAILKEPPMKPKKSSEPGKFELASLPAGTAVLDLKAPGYGCQRIEIQILPGQTASEAKVTLLPPCVLEGRVEIAPGKGYEAEIAPVRIDTGEEMEKFKTSADGSFKIDSLPAGEYLMSANAPGRGLRRPQKVSLKHGETTRVDYLLGRNGGVKGTVSFPDTFWFTKLYLREPGTNQPPDLWPDSFSTKEPILTYTVVQEPGKTYELASIPEGTWELVAVAYPLERGISFAERPHEIRTIIIKDNETVEADFTLAEVPRELKK